MTQTQFLIKLIEHAKAEYAFHVWTFIGVALLGLILFRVLYLYRRKKTALKGAEDAVDSLMASNKRLMGEADVWRKLFGPFPYLYEHGPEKDLCHNHNDMTIAVDLDGVILKYVEPWTGINHFGAVEPGAIEALTKLRKMGYRIAIYTTRNNSMAAHNGDHNALELTALVQNQLEKSGIPYDFISLFKPMARYYIDDRAIRFENWDKVMEQIRIGEGERAIKKLDRMDREMRSCGLDEQKHE